MNVDHSLLDEPMGATHPKVGLTKRWTEDEGRGVEWGRAVEPKQTEARAGPRVDRERMTREGHHDIIGLSFMATCKAAEEGEAEILRVPMSPMIAAGFTTS